MFSLLLQVATLERIDEVLEVRLASRQRRAADAVEAVYLVLEPKLQFGKLLSVDLQFLRFAAIGVLLLASLKAQELLRVEIEVQRFVFCAVVVLQDLPVD